MAMKYLKLFENWLLTEGKQVEAFDAAKPDMWPVMETTIENAQEAKLSAKFLKSIFGRAMDEGNRAKLDITEAQLSSPKISFQIPVFFANKVAKNTDLRKFSKFIDLLTSDLVTIVPITKEYPSALQSVTIPQAAKVKAKMEEYVEVLTNYTGKTTFEERPAFKAVFKKATSKPFRDGCIALLNGWIKGLDQRVEEAGNKKVMTFDIFWEQDRIFTVEINDKIGEGQEKTDAIIDYKCLNLYTDLNPYKIDDNGNPIVNEAGDDYEDNPLYKALKMDDIMAIDYSTVNLTFGMIMAWLNRWQNGDSYTPALSKTGSTEYKNICKNEIFDGEEREFLAEFKSTTFDIGGKSFKLANSKTDNTIVPIFALNKVVGTVTFAFNSYEIPAEDMKSLDSPELWKALASAKKSIVIVGNTDGMGSDNINDPLSEKRAKAVLDVIMKNTKKMKTLKTKNITKRGDGKKNPLKPDNKGRDKEAAALNRRVEIIIDDKKASDIIKGQL